LIDFKSDPRFNIPESANVATMPVEILGQYVPGKEESKGELVFYAGDFTNLDVAEAQLKKLSKQWRAVSGYSEYVNAHTLKLTNVKGDIIGFYYIDMLPYDGKQEEWDK
jgi:hypothetical protein